MRRLFAIAIVLAGCGVGNHAITGTFRLVDSDVDYGSSSCSGSGGYADIREGTDVVVKDGAGTIIAKSKLTYDPSGSSSRGCS